jgi:hypothetical protein
MPTDASRFDSWDIERLGRDPYLWNVACDYVINGWLVEMGLGELPKVGAIYDPEVFMLLGDYVASGAYANSTFTAYRQSRQKRGS